MQVGCNGAIMLPLALSKGDGSGTPHRGQTRARARGRLCPRMKLTQQQIIISALFDLDHKCDPTGRLGGLGRGLRRGVWPVPVGGECGLRLTGLAAT